jgi:hypothetical protein
MDTILLILIVTLKLIFLLAATALFAYCLYHLEEMK